MYVVKYSLKRFSSYSVSIVSLIYYSTQHACNSTHYCIIVLIISKHQMNTMLNKENCDQFKVNNKCTECPVFCYFQVLTQCMLW